MRRLFVLTILVAVVAAACSAQETIVTPASTATTTLVPTTTHAPTTTTSSATTTTTLSSTTTSAPAGIETSPVVPGADADVDAIVEAYLVVFDSATTYDDKVPFITDASGLEETVANYAAAGDEVGGITLQADEVGIDGNEAMVIYSFLFAGNAAYSDLEGDAGLTDVGWQISRDFFCEIMVLARVGCP